MKIAVSGYIDSGKSTIAREFEKKGFYLLNYTEQIKDEVAKAMAAVGVAKTREAASEEIHGEIEFYRPLLIAWADACGWSDGSRLKLLLPEVYQEHIVLDNIRFLAQANIVKEAGFVTVRLEGGRKTDLPSERDLDSYKFDITVPWMDTVEERMDYIQKELDKLKKS